MVRERVQFPPRILNTYLAQKAERPRKLGVRGWFDSIGRCMKASISQLEIALATMENNEPINRREGNIEQADLELANAEDYRMAIEVLKIVSEHS